MDGGADGIEAAQGFDRGVIVGERGSKTDGALGKFKASRGLIPRPYIGPITLEKLSAPVVSPSTGGWPNWLNVAYMYLGLKEIPGARDNAQIVAWWQDIGAGWFDDDKLPWGNAFVGGTLLAAGIEIPSKALIFHLREKWGKNLTVRHRRHVFAQIRARQLWQSRLCYGTKRRSHRLSKRKSVKGGDGGEF